MELNQFGPKYPTCDHIERKKAEEIASKDLISKLTREAEVLPLFEEKLYQYKHKKNSSLLNNELLRCRWFEFVKRQQGAIKTPFRFPCVDDYHFSKFSIRYEPKESTCNRRNNRYHLKSGPGVDKFGQMPIPDNMHLRKTVDKYDKADTVQSPKSTKPKSAKMKTIKKKKNS